MSAPQGITQGSGDLDILPNEVLGIVVDQMAFKDMKNKNDVLTMRLVCKRFNDVIRPKVLKTIQMDFDRISKNGHQAVLDALGNIGQQAKALTIDLAAVRSQCKFMPMPTQIPCC